MKISDSYNTCLTTEKAYIILRQYNLKFKIFIPNSVPLIKLTVTPPYYYYYYQKP